MTISQRIELIREKFEPGPELDLILQPFYDMKAQEDAAIESYMRPMGVEQPKPAPVFKPMKPSASIFIAGETDEEVAKNVLLVCWGTVAK